MPSNKDIAYRIALSLFAGAFFVFTGLQCRHDYPYIEQPRDAARRATCRNNMKQIGIALHNYHDEHGSFPPAFLTDKDGRRLHSWRTLLLPFLEQTPLFEEIDLNSPWNDQPQIDEPSVPVLQCPATRGGNNKTSYVAVIGGKTTWRKDGVIRLSDIKDDHASTILLIEMDHLEPHWAAPSDVAIEDLSLTVNNRTKPSLSSGHSVRSTWFWQPRINVAHVVFADGNTLPIRADTPPDVVEAMLTIDGGEEIDRDAWIARRRSLTPGFCLGIGLLLVVFVWLTTVARRYAAIYGGLLGVAMAVLSGDPCLIGIPVTLLWTLIGWRISRIYRDVDRIEEERNEIRNVAD